MLFASMIRAAEPEVAPSRHPVFRVAARTAPRRPVPVHDISSAAQRAVHTAVGEVVDIHVAAFDLTADVVVHVLFGNSPC